MSVYRSAEWSRRSHGTYATTLLLDTTELSHSSDSTTSTYSSTSITGLASLDILLQTPASKASDLMKEGCLLQASRIPLHCMKGRK